MIVPRVALDRMQRGLHALRRGVVAEVEDVNRLISHVLRGGIVVASGLVVFAFVVSLAETGALPSTGVSIREIPVQLLRLNPDAFLSTGILVLVFTPLASVFASLLSFVEERDRAYVLVTGIVLANLLVSLLLGLA